MVTATVQIGNSDDKLSQERWSVFVKKVQNAIDSTCEQVHFFGGSQNWLAWQNVCWVFVIPEENVERLEEYLTNWRELYEQDSVALTLGETKFV